MTPNITRAARTALCGLAVLAALLPAPASAATFRYASSSNRIYVEGGGVATLSAIKAALPAAPLDAVSAGVWLLRAHVIVEDGSVLELHGSAAGGDATEVRLLSEGSTWVSIIADHGALSLRHTKVQSWNRAGNGPDTEYATGRAFLRVRSRLAADGVTPLESRMDIVASEVAYLGYNAAESYGLVWKVVGTGAGLYDKVNVYGDILDSNIHHNYFGMYTFGHEGGQWLRNEVHHNVQYGFDPHDDSDNLLIEGNDVHDNGNHGIIASKRCNNVVIRGNRSYSNAGNGIMLHRSSDDGLVEDNDSYLNADSGLSLFGSDRTIVRNNRFLDNGNAAIRFSVGADDNLVEDNDLGFSGKYGLYFYKGSDAPEPGEDGRNRRNILRRNQIHDSTSDSVKLEDSDDNRFEANVLRANGPAMRFTRARGNSLAKNTLPSEAIVTLAGASDSATTLDVLDQSTTRLSQDAHSTATFTDNGGQVFDPDEAVYTSITTGRSTLALTSSDTGGSTTVRRRSFTAKTASGTAKVNPTTWNTSGDRSKAWNVQASSGSTAITYRVGNLAPGAVYGVFRGSTRIATLTADPAGFIGFASAPGSTSTVAYAVRPD